MEIIATDRGNRYIYERETGFISLISDTIAEYIETSPDSHYYLEKFKYLADHGLISTTSSFSTKFRLIEKKEIADAIFNTHQIIFEVTDKCNLNCRYCGYGELYDNYDKRENKNMSFETFKTLYDYLKGLWHQTPAKGCSYLRISFYGGEPLCNFSFIEKAVLYTKAYPIPNKRIVFSMTTNAVLLDKYMSFLVDNQFELLISLDGNKHNQSYRIFKTGKNSFETVIKNIDKLYYTFPSFFRSNVKFNSVLHDRNSIKEAEDFIYKRYQIHPQTSELNIFGIALRKRAEFRKMFHSKSHEFRVMTDADKCKYANHSSLILQCEKWVFSTFLMDYSHNIKNALMFDFKDKIKHGLPKLPTSTCIPFSRKIFVTVNNKIFPCERIGNELNFGNISHGKVIIDYSNILKEYNKLFRKYIKLCHHCKQRESCAVCIVSDIYGYKICKANINNKELKDISSHISHINEDPQILNNALTNISIV